MASNMTGLVDQHGEPIRSAEIAVLKTEIAAPDGFSARPPFAGHLAFNVRPERLGAILRAADNGQTRDWFIIAEEIEELFPHYSAVLSKRRRQVSLLPITVEAADNVADGEKHADFVRKWLEIGVLERALYDVTDAIGKAYSINELKWDTRPDGTWPCDIAWRNQRDFEVSWEDGQTIWLRDQAGYLPLAPHKFLLHRHLTKSGNAVRSGLTRMVCWLWMYSTFTMKDWALFVQGYGLPWRIGRYGPEASDMDKRTLWKAVRGIAGDMAAIVPKSMEMELIESKGAADGAKLFTDRQNWLNYEVSKLVLGGTAGTDAIKGGHAVGQEHRSAEQDVEKFDARLIAGSINRQVVQAMIAFTFGQQGGYPRLVIGQQELVPLSDVIAAVADLGPLGLKVKASEVLGRLQLTVPEGDEAVIGMPPAAPPGATNADVSPIAKADVTIKANPHPEINPSSDARALMTAGRLFGRFITMQAEQAGGDEVKEVLAALDDRLARDAAGALAGMTEHVRAEFAAATDLPDLAERLAKLKLDDGAFAQAMTQGMALANIAGQAMLMDELRPLGRRG